MSVWMFTHFVNIKGRQNSLSPSLPFEMYWNLEIFYFE